MPPIVWKHYLDFGKVFREVEAMEFLEQRRKLSETLKVESEKLPDVWPRHLKRVVADYATCIGLCEDIEEVDAILEEIYDFADAEHISMGL